MLLSPQPPTLLRDSVRLPAAHHDYEPPSRSVRDDHLTLPCLHRRAIGDHTGAHRSQQTCGNRIAPCRAAQSPSRRAGDRTESAGRCESSVAPNFMGRSHVFQPPVTAPALAATAFSTPPTRQTIDLGCQCRKRRRAGKSRPVGRSCGKDHQPPEESAANPFGNACGWPCRRPSLR
jgi:hypothetical protein